MKIEAATVHDIVHICHACTTTDSCRYALDGVLFEFDGTQLTTVGTDGRQLVVHRGTYVPESGDAFTAPVVVDLRPLARLRAKLAMESASVVSVHTDGRSLTFCWSTKSKAKFLAHSVICPIIAGRYPPWRDVFPKAVPTGTAIVACDDLVTAWQAYDQVETYDLRINGDVAITTPTIPSFQVREHSGVDISFHGNLPWIVDHVSRLRFNMLSVAYHGPKAPIHIITPSTEYLLMPCE